MYSKFGNENLYILFTRYSVNTEEGAVLVVEHKKWDGEQEAATFLINMCY